MRKLQWQDRVSLVWFAVYVVYAVALFQSPFTVVSPLMLVMILLAFWGAAFLLLAD